jgi:hypothetical protein
MLKMCGVDAPTSTHQQDDDADVNDIVDDFANIQLQSSSPTPEVTDNETTSTAPTSRTPDTIVCDGKLPAWAAVSADEDAEVDHIATLYSMCNICLEEHHHTLLQKVEGCGHFYSEICLEYILAQGIQRRYNCKSCREWMAGLRV